MESVFQHQRKFAFEGVTISSEFPCGNLAQCQLVDGNYNLWIGNDPNSKYRTWFYFSVEGVARKTVVSFTIKNMSNQAKLYKQGMQPVFKQEGNSWERIKVPIMTSSFLSTSVGFQFQFRHCFQTSTKVFFAFTYPWTLQDWSSLAQELENWCTANKQVYFNRSTLIHTPEHRPVQLITITKGSLGQKMNLPQQGLFPKSNPPDQFPDKKGILLSARVHPGQVPSSHILNGFVKALMANSEQSTALLNNCVVYIIPFINPDGVSRGLYRSNAQGHNLNRHYLQPDEKLQPEIYAIKTLVAHLVRNQRLECCLDLHAHAGKKGCFIYGNSVADIKKQLDVCLLPKLMSLNSPDFDYDACNFSEANMYQKDKGDDLSKQGAARVAFYKTTNLHKCWTLQVNYNTGRFKNLIFKKGAPADKFNINSINKGTVLDYFGEDNIPATNYYTVESYEGIGCSVLQSFVDYFELLPGSSRIYTSPYKNMKTLKLNLAVSILRMIPFKFDESTRKILQSLNQQDRLFDALKKLHSAIGNSCEQSAKIWSGPSVRIPRPPIASSIGTKRISSIVMTKVLVNRSSSIRRSSNSIKKK